MDETERMNRMESTIEAALEDGLRTVPLEAAPAGIYQFVMQHIDARKQPARDSRLPAAQSQPAPFERVTFRVSWLDLALSLFGAGMLVLTGLMWSWLPAPLAAYLRMQMLYNGQMLLYGNTTLLFWCSLALAALLAGLLLGAWSCVRLGICRRRI